MEEKVEQKSIAQAEQAVMAAKLEKRAAADAARAALKPRNPEVKGAVEKEAEAHTGLSSNHPASLVQAVAAPVVEAPVEAAAPVVEAVPV